MQATIEEPLICHTIYGFLNLCEVDRLRRVCRTFLEVGNLLLRDVNVIATCGLYTNDGPNVVPTYKYYAPCLDMQVDPIDIEYERESYMVATIDTLNCVLVKNDVDHVLFGKYFGFIKHDCIELRHTNFSNETLDDEPWDLMTTSYAMAIYLDNRTKKHAIGGSRSLCESLFEEAITVGKITVPGVLSELHTKFTCVNTDEGILIRPKSGYATIEEFHNVARLYAAPSKLMFDGRLIFC